MHFANRVEISEQRLQQRGILVGEFGLVEVAFDAAQPYKHYCHIVEFVDH